MTTQKGNENDLSKFLAEHDIELIEVDNSNGVEEYKLKHNDMQVLLVHRPGRTAAVFIVTLFGSRNEHAGNTGHTHELEHMKFKGSKNFDPRLQTAIDDVLRPIGGMNNASTSYDRIEYHEEFPAAQENIELALAFERDRLMQGGLLLRDEDLKSEAPVVDNERTRGENNPDAVLTDATAAISILAHPYHHPVIGWESDVKSVTVEKLRAFLSVYDWPNNATAIVVGEFDKLEVLSSIAKQLSTLPKSPEPIPQVTTVEPKQEGQRRYTIKRGQDLPRVTIGFRSPSATHPDSPALSLLGDILGNSNRHGTRLYKALIDSAKPLATDAYASNAEFRDPFLFLMSAGCSPDVEPQQVEVELFATINALTTNPVSADELHRAKNFRTKGYTLHEEGILDLGSQFVEAVANGDWHLAVTYRERINAVTAADISRVAKQYLVVEHSTVGYYEPDDSPAAETEIAPASADAETTSKIEPAVSTAESPACVPNAQCGSCPALALKSCKKHKRNNARPTRIPEFPSYTSQTKQVVLSNGMKLLVMPVAGAHAVSVAGSILAGDAFSPKGKSIAAELMASLLTRGSKRYSAEVLASKLDDMGTALDFATDLYTCFFRTDLVAEDTESFIDIIADVIQNPAFPENEFENLKALYEGLLTGKESSTSAIADNALFQALYESDSPFFEKSFDEMAKDVTSSTLDELKAFHKAHFTPANTTLAIVGNIADVDKLVALVESKFGAWQGGARNKIAPPTVKLPENAQTIVKHIPGKANVDICIGIPALISADSPNFYAAEVANGEIGIDPFTSLIGVIRTKYGLTYGIRSHFVNPLVSGLPWMIRLSVNPENVDIALKHLQEVFAQLLKDGIKESDIPLEIGRAQGGYILALHTPGDIAAEMVHCESYLPGHGIEFMDNLPLKVKEVTKEQIDQVIRELIRPDKLVTVIAGTVPEKK